MTNLNEMSYKEIQQMATELGIEKVVGVKKADLIAQIEAAQATAQPEEAPAVEEKKETLGAKIYRNIQTKHPDWSAKKCYAVTGNILRSKNTKAVEAAAADGTVMEPEVAES